jgi:nickel-dependent lactate racemase
MSDKILGMNANVVYVVIIILCILFGIITFNYYAYISSGNKSVLSGGIGSSFVLMPYNKAEHFGCEWCQKMNANCTHPVSGETLPDRMCNLCLKNCEGK